jgi:long-chain acyl-CoA synthetase
LDHDGERLVEVLRTTLGSNPSARAIHFQGRWLSWGTLQTAALAVERALRESGVDPRAPVAVLPRTCPEFAGALLGLFAHARPIMMVYTYQSASAIAAEVRKKTPAAIIGASKDWTLELVDVAEELGSAGISLNDVDEEVDVVPGLARVRGVAAEQRAEPQVLLLTSGTTGPPKGYPMSYGLIQRAMLDFMPIGRAADVLPSLLFFPMGNISGLYAIMTVLHGQNCGVMLEKFTIEGWLDFVRTYRPKTINVPPAAVRMALDANLPGEDLASLQSIVSGAAPLDPTAHLAFEQRYGIQILLCYGATEFGGPVTLMTPDLRKEAGNARFDSVGKAWARSKLRIVDPATRKELPTDAMDVIEVSVPRVGPGWIHTTDLGRIDADGFVFHCGRTDGVINRGGFKIIPDKVEKALALHPAVAACAVIGVPDQRLGEVPVAAIELRPGASPPSPAELELLVRQHVPSTHVPVMFKIVAVMPRTASLKVDMSAARDIFRAARTEDKR